MNDRPPVITLPAQPSSVSAARRFLSSRLSQHITDTTVASDAVLVVSELVTNAVLHGKGPIVVEVSFAQETTSEATSASDPAVRIVVSDASPVPPAMRDYGEGASTGRGLALVAALARRWGVEVADPGKAVWVELDATSADGTAMPPHVELQPRSAAVADAPPVQFLGVPVDGYLCLQQHNDDILRELELLSFSTDGDRTDPDSELARVVEHARRFFRTNREGLRGEVMAAAARGQRMIDLESAVTIAVLAPAMEMVAVFEDAERLGASGLLLLGPPDRDVVHLRRWFVDELRRQVVDGEEPAPYVPLGP